jgi:hypothetical protein
VRLIAEPATERVDQCGRLLRYVVRVRDGLNVNVQPVRVGAAARYFYRGDGSPNFVRFVYDGNNSAGGGTVGPAGSGAIEQSFFEYFAAIGLPNEPTPFNGRSDYGPFIAAGDPSRRRLYGRRGSGNGCAGSHLRRHGGTHIDPRYHLSCDTYAGTAGALALTALDQMSDGVAHIVLTYSKRNFAKEPLIDP